MPFGVSELYSEVVLVNCFTHKTYVQHKCNDIVIFFSPYGQRSNVLCIHHLPCTVSSQISETFGDLF